MGWVVRPLIWLIRLYQRFTKWWPPVCRFRPSCSEYAIQALQVHGFWCGLVMSCWRILRCNPICAGGDDPVPPRKTVAADTDNERTT